MGTSACSPLCSASSTESSCSSCCCASSSCCCASSALGGGASAGLLAAAAAVAAAAAAAQEEAQAGSRRLARAQERSQIPSPRFLRVGERVRVKRSLGQPRYNWSPVSHSSVGTITSIDSDGGCEVRFPEHSSWQGRISEIERAQTATSTDIATPVATHRVVTDRKPIGLLQINQQVECRDAADSAWQSGVVTSIDPLLVKPAGWEKGCKWDHVQPLHAALAHRAPAAAVALGRPTKGAVVCIIAGSVRKGSLGVIIKDYRDRRPYEVSFSNGESHWYTELDVGWCSELDMRGGSAEELAGLACAVGGVATFASFAGEDEIAVASDFAADLATHNSLNGAIQRQATGFVRAAIIDMALEFAVEELAAAGLTITAAAVLGVEAGAILGPAGMVVGAVASAAAATEVGAAVVGGAVLAAEVGAAVVGGAVLAAEAGAAVLGAEAVMGGAVLGAEAVMGGLAFLGPVGWLIGAFGVVAGLAMAASGSDDR